MCFRPVKVKKREIECPNCKKMNPLPLSIASPIADILNNEKGKAIFEKHCSVLMSNPQFDKAKRMTLKQIKPMSRGQVTLSMIDLVANDLAQLPVDKKCKFCGEDLPL